MKAGIINKEGCLHKLCDLAIWRLGEGEETRLEVGSWKIEVGSLEGWKIGVMMSLVIVIKSVPRTQDQFRAKRKLPQITRSKLQDR